MSGTQELRADGAGGGCASPTYHLATRDAHLAIVTCLLRQSTTCVAVVALVVLAFNIVLRGVCIWCVRIDLVVLASNNVVRV